MFLVIQQQDEQWICVCNILDVTEGEIAYAIRLQMFHVP